MDDHIYKDIILEHWQNPQNYGLLKKPDINIELENPYCGDKIRLTIKLNDEKIDQILFTGEGCAISKASASMFTEYLKHKSITECKRMKAQNVLALLGIPLTPTRTKCALLIYSALKKGLAGTA